MLKSKQYNARGLFLSERLTAVLKKIPDYFFNDYRSAHGVWENNGGKRIFKPSGNLSGCGKQYTIRKQHISGMTFVKL